MADRRWNTLRRAARARLAPFGAVVLLGALVIALAAPMVSPHDPLKQNLGNALAKLRLGALVSALAAPLVDRPTR